MVLRATSPSSIRRAFPPLYNNDVCIFHIEKNAVVVDKRVRGERSQNRSFSRDEKRERVVVVVVVQTTEASQSCSKKEVVKVKRKRYPDKRQRYISTPSIFQFDIREKKKKKKEHHHLGEMMIRVVVVVVVVAVAVVVPSRSPPFHGWWWCSLSAWSLVV